MRYIQTGIILCVMFSLFSFEALGQTSTKINIETVVRNPEGIPIAGAIVNGDEGKTVTETDASGRFTIDVSPNSVLYIKAVGYNSRIVAAIPDMDDITLEYSENTAPAYIAHRTVEKRDLLGGVAVLNPADYLDMNYTSYATDGVDAYIGGLSAGTLWGMDECLILIDGVRRDIEDVQTVEVEQISFLKGVGAVALYGSHAAKGVILITTKRGEAHNRQINVRANTGFYIPKQYPKYVGSAEYMTLYNEALRNDGLNELYSAETIYNHYAGTNPYRYPDVDYYSSEYLKKAYNRSDVNAEISGGNDRARFYTNVGFWYANSLLDFGEAKNDNTNRFNVRGNVDLKLNDFISSSVDVSTVFYNARGAHGDYWGSAATLRPHRFSPLIPISMIEESDEASWLQVNNSRNVIDGQYVLGGTQQDMKNPFADIYAGGYNKFTSRQFQFTNGINVDLQKLLQGLSFHTRLNVDYSTRYNQAINNTYAVYAPAWNNYGGTDQIGSLQKFGEDASSGEQELTGSWQQQVIGFSAQFNYINTFRDVHNVSAILLATGTQWKTTGDYHRNSNTNLGIQLGYNYQHKYYADFTGAVVHSARLAKGNRQAFSPTLSLGWLVSGEDFLSDSPIVDHLKLTASAGILHTDLDINGYYLYDRAYLQRDGAWYSWRDGATQTQSTDSRRGANPDLFFAKRKEFNAGIEASLFKKLITVEVNGFVNSMTGLITQPATSYPSYFTTGWPNSSFIPYVNFNNDRRAGFDFSVDINKRTGQVDWTLGFAGTYHKTKATKRDELYADEYQNRTGKSLNAIFGLVSDGFFKDDQDIANHATQAFGEVRPGDIKYVDQNNDGIIDDRDQVMIGEWYAPFSFGIRLSAKWKNFTFFALGTGSTGGNSVKNSSYYWVAGDDKYSAVVRDRWTKETMDTATYPRLTTLSGENNFRTSDFWLVKTNRFDLAKIQVTYDLPKRIFHGSFIRELSVYASGNSLLTISKEREFLEMNIGSDPQARSFNMGLKAVF